MFYAFEISKTSKRKMYVGLDYFLTPNISKAKTFKNWAEVNRFMGILNAQGIYEKESI